MNETEGNDTLIKGVLFDYGHTLVYWPKLSKVRVAAVLNVRNILKREGYVFQVHQIKNVMDKVFSESRNIEVSAQEEFKKILMRLGVYSGALEKKTVGAFWKPYVEMAQPRANAKEVLSLLKENGYKLGVVANIQSEGIHPVLEKFSLRKYFDAVVVSSEIGCGKPDSKIFLQALKTMGVHPPQTIMVGDNPTTDIIGAKKAGIVTVRLFRGPNRNQPDQIEPNFRIQNLDRLVSIIEALG